MNIVMFPPLTMTISNDFWATMICQMMASIANNEIEDDHYHEYPCQDADAKIITVIADNARTHPITNVLSRKKSDSSQRDVVLPKLSGYSLTNYYSKIRKQVHTNKRVSRTAFIRKINELETEIDRFTLTQPQSYHQVSQGNLPRKVKRQPFDSRRSSDSKIVMSNKNENNSLTHMNCVSNTDETIQYLTECNHLLQQIIIGDVEVMNGLNSMTANFSALQKQLTMKSNHYDCAPCPPIRRSKQHQPIIIDEASSNYHMSKKQQKPNQYNASMA